MFSRRGLLAAIVCSLVKEMHGGGSRHNTTLYYVSLSLGFGNTEIQMPIQISSVGQLSALDIAVHVIGSLLPFNFTNVLFTKLSSQCNQMISCKIISSLIYIKLFARIEIGWNTTSEQQKFCIYDEDDGDDQIGLH